MSQNDAPAVVTRDPPAPIPSDEDIERNVKMIYGEDTAAVRVVLADLAYSFLRATQAYHPLEDGHVYGEPRQWEHVGSPFVSPKGEPRDIYYSQAMSRGKMSVTATTATLAHCYKFPIVLKGIFDALANETLVSLRSLGQYETGGMKMREDAVDAIVSGLVKTVAYLTNTHAIRWSIGICSACKTYFFSNVATIQLSNGTRGRENMPLDEMVNVDRIDIGPEGVSFILIVEKSALARTLCGGKSSIMGHSKGIVLVCQGQPRLQDHRWANYFACSFPSAPCLVVFDLDLNGLRAVANFRRGLIGTQHLPEYKSLALGDGRVIHAGLTFSQYEAAPKRVLGTPFEGDDEDQLRRLIPRFPDNEQAQLNKLLAHGHWQHMEDISSTSWFKAIGVHIRGIIEEHCRVPSIYVDYCRPQTQPPFPAATDKVVNDLFEAASFWHTAYVKYKDDASVLPVPLAAPQRQLTAVPRPLKRRRLENPKDQPEELAIALMGLGQGRKWLWSPEFEACLGVTEMQSKLELPAEHLDHSATACVAAFTSTVQNPSSIWCCLSTASSSYLQEALGKDESKRMLEAASALFD